MNSNNESDVIEEGTNKTFMSKLSMKKKDKVRNVAGRCFWKTDIKTPSSLFLIRLPSKTKAQMTSYPVLGQINNDKLVGKLQTCNSSQVSSPRTSSEVSSHLSEFPVKFQFNTGFKSHTDTWGLHILSSEIPMIKRSIYL